MTGEFLHDPSGESRGNTATRAIRGDDSAAAAELVRLVRQRPHDRIDPFPPCIEAEVLADTGARGSGDDVNPRVAVAGDEVVGYGAVDFSPKLKRAQLIGPVVHPAHRRRGLGRQLLRDLRDQAAANGQKVLRACVAANNAAGQALLEKDKFKRRDAHTCLRLSRPEHFADLEMPGIELRRAWHDDAPEIYHFLERMVPRSEKQTRSLLKTDTYAVLTAFQNGALVAVAEVDMRAGETATVEYLEGKPSLLHKGLGNVLMAEAVRVVFERDGVEHLDFLVPGTDPKRLASYTEAGFEVRDEFVAFERKL